MILGAETIGELLNSRGVTDKDKTFLIVPESGLSITFGMAAAQVRSINARLQRQGFVPGDTVATILHNSKEAALILLAVMAAGGVAVPLNPRLTGAEIAVALDQSGAGFVITAAAQDPPLSGSIPSSAAAVDFVLVARNSLDSGTPGIPVTINHKSPALILFTSGTTGTPKGVVLSHHNLLTNASYVRDAHELTSDDRALCILPLFHINGLVVTLLTPLLTGMGVVLPHKFCAEQFWHWIADHRVTWFSAVPTILSLLLSHQMPEPHQLATLRFARSASAPLPVALLGEFEQRSGIPVIETYGISEAACQVTANPLPPLLRKPGSAGKPVGNELRVVDEQGTVLPVATIGEVIIKGENLFNGYLNNPEADAEALKDGWFHTGDLGYLDRDGYLFLTGRKKELINRAGEKISPREVEEVIHRLPQVEAAGVVGVPHQLYGEEVTAFVTLRPGTVLEPDTIRQFCSRHLAPFKVPREIFFISEFPKGPSGKIQRRLLVDIYSELNRGTLP